ncbi:VOC family protein [Nocardioides sp. C4-1]|uniref:VOC family protein n=1 Tax=Nocardioides sp. C4-1 TaxID=3151851 RepID=UPI0032679E5A
MSGPGPWTPSWLTAFVDLAPDHFERGVVFWAEVTGSRVSPSRGHHDEFVTLVPRDGDAYLRVQRLGSPTSGHHLDLHVPDPRGAAARAVGLGAAEVAGPGADVVVLRSPAGLVFCLVAAHETRLSSPVRWPGGRSQVNQVALDIGPSSFDRERDFWEELTGFTPSDTGSPELKRLDGGGPLRVLLQRLGDDREPGYHLDLAADDRAAETERHVSLGATVEGVHSRWTVLADPAGTRYCITDRVPR